MIRVQLVKRLRRLFPEGFVAVNMDCYSPSDCPDVIQVEIFVHVPNQPVFSFENWASAVRHVEMLELQNLPNTAVQEAENIVRGL